MNIFNSEEYQLSRQERERILSESTLIKTQKYTSSMHRYNPIPEKYEVTVETYEYLPKYWGYLKVKVLNKDTGKEMVFTRNYNSLSFLFCQQNGKDYFISGEDYQGVTVLNLTDETSNTYIPEEWLRGGGWCITMLEEWEDNELTSEGCVWAGPYTKRRFKIPDLDNISLEDFEEWYEEPEDFDDDDEDEDDTPSTTENSSGTKNYNITTDC